MPRRLYTQQIKKIIDENNFDLRKLLKFLRYPKIEYKVYFLTKILNNNEDEIRKSYILDDEYCFNSSFSNEEYYDLERFELEYYEVLFSKYEDFFYYNAKEHTLYFYVFRSYYDELPTIYEDDLFEEDEIDMKDAEVIISSIEKRKQAW